MVAMVMEENAVAYLLLSTFIVRACTYLALLYAVHFVFY